MPTTFGTVMMGLLVVLAVVGLVLWARQTQRRKSEPLRPVRPEAPWDENTAADQADRQADRGGLL